MPNIAFHSEVVKQVIQGLKAGEYPRPGCAGGLIMSESTRQAYAAHQPALADEGKPPKYFIPDLPRSPIDHGDRGPHYTTWIFVRSNSADDGSRSLPRGTVFSDSPTSGARAQRGSTSPFPVSRRRSSPA